jgi:hypothetical protein
MKALIILWFVFWFGVFSYFTHVADKLYKRLYFDKQTPERQTEIMNWINEKDSSTTCVY